MYENPIIIKSEPKVFDLPGLGKLKALEIQDANGKPKSIRYGGVRFAKPPVGDLRWRRPVPLPSDFDYSGDYTEFKTICPQPYYNNRGEDPNPDFHYDEDCLFLNIWVPSGEPPKGGWPVLYFIHGGWLQVGNPHQYRQADPQDLQNSPSPARFIIVSPGYRLNLFGFLSSNELLEEDPKNSNFGFWDQRLGLEWVSEHIASFGGDKDNITLGGLSAGSYSAVFQVAYEVYHPEQKQIIKRVFLQSNALPAQPKKIEESEIQFNEVLTKFGVPLDISSSEKLKKLRAIPFEKLADEIMNLQLHTFRAVTDGDFVSPTMWRDIYDGTFGKEIAKSGRSFLIGEVNNEYIVYKTTNPPKSPDDFVNQLNNYYSKDIVDQLLKIYPKAEKSDDPDEYLENVHDLFGKIVSDMQVYVSGRILVNGLIKGGVPIENILRYRIEYRGKYLDEYIPPEFKIPHAGDFGIWFYNEVSGITPEETPLYFKWLAPYGEFIYKSKAEWGTQKPNEYRKFNEDGTITIEEDPRWDFALSVGHSLATNVKDSHL